MTFAAETPTGRRFSGHGGIVAVLLDTTVLIDLLRGNSAAREYLSRLTEVPLASEVTRA